MGAPRILLVEDDDAIAVGLTRVLEAHRAIRSVDWPAARRRSPRPLDADLIVLDLGLPDVDGIDVCRKLRTARSDLAILILTARDQELDVVAGLDAGADDYLIKPFRLSELLARVRAHLRRAAAVSSGEPARELRARDLTVDRAARRRLARRRARAAAQRVRPTRPAHHRSRPRRHPRTHHAQVWDTEWLGSTKTPTRTCSRCGPSSEPTRSPRCAALATA